MSDKCIWTKNISKLDRSDETTVSCRTNKEDYFISHFDYASYNYASSYNCADPRYMSEMDNFKYCPFCGKKIEFIKKDIRR